MGRGLWCSYALVDMRRRRRQLGQETIGRKQEDGGRRNWTMIDREEAVRRRETERQLTARGVTDGGVFCENRSPGGIEGRAPN